MPREINHWDIRFLELAEFISKWSKDPSTEVGAIITDTDNRIISTGFNGFPRGVQDTHERLDDRTEKYPRMVHAERNAIIFARQNLKGCRLYNHPFIPCEICAGDIIQAGIKEVIVPSNTEGRGEVWGEKAKRISVEMFEEGKVKLILRYNDE